jgi:hypothetical protein
MRKLCFPGCVDGFCTGPRSSVELRPAEAGVAPGASALAGAAAPAPGASPVLASFPEHAQTQRCHDASPCTAVGREQWAQPYDAASYCV